MLAELESKYSSEWGNQEVTVEDMVIVARKLTEFLRDKMRVLEANSENEDAQTILAFLGREVRSVVQYMFENDGRDERT